MDASAQNAILASLSELHFHPVGHGRSSTRSSYRLESLNDGGLYSFEEVMTVLGHQWVDVLKIDIEGHEWELFTVFYSSPNARLPATQLLVEFHWIGAETAWKVGSGATDLPCSYCTLLNLLEAYTMLYAYQVLDAILADNYRVFSVEPNYYCLEGACARNLVEFAFIRVSNDGHICSPRSFTQGSGFEDMQLSNGC